MPNHKRKFDEVESDDEDSGIKVPPLTPTTVGAWRTNYQIRATIKFGDAATVLCNESDRDNNKPLYMKFEEDDWILNPDDPTAPDASLVDYRGLTDDQRNRAKKRLKKRRDEYDKLVEAYHSEIKKLFVDMMKNVSQDSYTALKKDPTKFATLLTKRDAGGMWDYIYLTHTASTLTASASEIRKARKAVEEYQQKIEGERTPYEIFVSGYKATLDEAKSLQPNMFTEKEEVSNFLRAVCTDGIEASMEILTNQEDVPDSADYPKDLLAANSIVRGYLSRRGVSDEPPSKRQKVASLADAAPNPRANGNSASEYFDCKFCELKHKGGVEFCFKFRDFMRDESAYVKAYLDKRSKKGGGGGKGGGKGGKRGRGGGGQGGGKRGGGDRGQGGQGGQGGGDGSNKYTYSKNKMKQVRKFANAVAKLDTEPDAAKKAAESLKKMFTETACVALVVDEYKKFDPTAYTATQLENLRAQYMMDGGANVVMYNGHTDITDICDIDPVDVTGVAESRQRQTCMGVFGEGYLDRTLPFTIVGKCVVEARGSTVYYHTKLTGRNYVVDDHYKFRVNENQLCFMSHEEAVLLKNSLDSGRKLKNLANVSVQDYSASESFTELLNMLESSSRAFAGVDNMQDFDRATTTRYYNAEMRRREGAVKIMHIVMNHPSDDRLVRMLDGGRIHGCPYSGKDVRAMRDIYGPCDACDKGKGKRPSAPEHAVRLAIPTRPGEELSADIYFLSIITRKGNPLVVPFLLCVDKFSDYIHCLRLENKTLEAVYDSFDKIIKWYASHDWEVRKITTDRERVLSALKPLMENREKRIEMDGPGAGDHEKLAERFAGILRERVRCVKAGCWYKFPQYLYIEILRDVTDHLNATINAKLNLEHSPMEIVTGKGLSYHAHFRAPLTTVGQFRVTDPQNNHADRTLLGIVVRRNIDEFGTLTIWGVEEGRTYNRAKLHSIAKPTESLRRTIEATIPAKEVLESQFFEPMEDRVSNKRKRKNHDPPLGHSGDHRGGGDTAVESSETIVPPSTDIIVPPSTDLLVPPSTDIISSRSDASDATVPPELEPVEEGAELLTSAEVNDEAQSDTEVQTGETGGHNAAEEVQQCAAGPDHDRIDPLRDRSDAGTMDTQPTGTADPDSDEKPDYPLKKGRTSLPTQPRGRRVQTTARKRRRKSPIQLDSEATAPTRRSLRAIKRKKPFEETAYCMDNMSAHQAMVFTVLLCFNLTIALMKSLYPKGWRDPIVKELTQFHDMEVGTPIFSPVPNLRHSKILGVKGFGKEKFNPSTGEFETLKFRLVPAGHMVDASQYTQSERSSPTVSMESVMLSCNIAAHERLHGFTMDIPGAYLNATLDDPHMVRFPRDLASEYITLYPDMADYLQRDGTLLFLVTKAFYGLPESSEKWFRVVTAFLKENGFESHPSDQGLWIKREGSEKMIIAMWVDDFLGWTTSTTMRDEFDKTVQLRFGKSRMQCGDTLPFLGMSISQPTRQGEVFVSMREYTKRIVETSGVTSTCETPNHRYLTTAKPNNCEPVNSTVFLSLLMSALFLGKRTRPEILTPLSILQSRSTSPDQYDMMALLQVFKYLRGTIDKRIRFSPKKIVLHYWVDASYASSDDCRGHNGIMATIGAHNAPFFVKSTKQKPVTRSSTESELVAVDLALQHLIWTRQILEFLGYPQHPAYIFQDNQSTILVCESGYSKSGRLKHMAIRYYFIKSLVEDGAIAFKYVRSRDMVADILTKPLSGELFYHLRDKILNERIQA